MKNYISIFATVICVISCDNNEEDHLTSDNTFTFDNVSYETPYCFFEDRGIEAGNRDFREYIIQLVSHEHDAEPFVYDNPNTHVITFALFSPSMTELQSGEYNPTKATDNYLCNKEWKPGENAGGAVVGLELNDNSSKYIEECPGVMITVKKLGDNQYYFSYSGYCDSGRSIKGSFKGSITILDFKKWGCWDD